MQQNELCFLTTHAKVELATTFKQLSLSVVTRGKHSQRQPMAASESRFDQGLRMSRIDGAMNPRTDADRFIRGRAHLRCYLSVEDGAKRRAPTITEDLPVQGKASKCHHRTQRAYVLHRRRSVRAHEATRLPHSTFIDTRDVGHE